MTADRTPPDGRSQLLEAAVRLLDEEGPDAFRARRLAREIGASTMALYSRFGGMGPLVDAVAREGFARLADAQERAAPTDDPVADILRLGMAYREFAARSKHLYAVMFGLTAPGGHRVSPPDMTDRTVSTTDREPAYDFLVAAVTRAIDAGRFAPAEPLQAAAQFWTVLHGYVTLELAGYFPSEHGLPMVLRPVTVNLCVGLGDSRAAAEASMAEIETETVGTAE